MLIFAAVDGTGPLSDIAYAKEFSTSFCSRIHAMTCWDKKYYQRGPSGDGVSTGTRGHFMANFVKTRYYIGTEDAFAGWLRPMPADPSTREIRPGVFLCGYSRGGAAAIEACWHLQRANIKVDCLILFDAVDRTHTAVDTAIIPPNVLSCYHALRDPATMSRYWFGNCGRKASPGVKYLEKMFFCTHGGVGGVPWPTADAAGAIDEGWSDLAFANFAHSGATNVTLAVEKLVSAKVWTWMTAHLTAELQSCGARITETQRALQAAAVQGLGTGPAAY